MAEDHLAHTIALALENVEAGGRPFASIIVRAGRIVATGMNRSAQTKDPTAHAEIEAIRAACRALDSESLRGCTLYTTAEPCPMCLGALYWAELDEIVFALAGQEVRTFYPGERRYHRAADFYAQFALPFAERRLPMRLERRDACVRLLERWKALNG